MVSRAGITPGKASARNVRIPDGAPDSRAVVAHSLMRRSGWQTWPLHGSGLPSLLMHEHDETPDDAMELIVVVEIPMVGVGVSPNVAVAASLVLYRLAGFL
jgi:hypothetical protein